MATFDGDAVLDLDALASQTFGDRDLQRDLLELFELQALRLLPIIAGSGDNRSRGDAAHTLRGGAAAIGANRVASISGALEGASRDGDVSERDPLCEQLRAAVAEVRSAISAWRAAHG